MEYDFPFDVESHIIPVFPAREYPQALIDQTKDVYLAVKQYVPRQSQHTLSSPRDDTTAVTIVASGGVGFIKELYEPLFADILHHARECNVTIRAIWMPDVFNTGESAVANRTNLGCDPSWLDASHDLWSMICHFRTEMRRPIMGLGHSMGCTHLTYLSTWHPRLFTSLAFVEPGLDPEYGKDVIFPWAMQTLRRKDSWPTREQAEKDMVKAHSASSWDPRTISRLKKSSIYEATSQDGYSKEWRATTPRNQIAGLVFRYNPRRLGATSESFEAMTLEEREAIPDMDPNGHNPGQVYRPELIEAWNLVPKLRPHVLYVNGSNSPFFSPAKRREERARITGTGVGGSGGMRLGAVEQVVIQGGEHTMVFDEHIGEIARHIAAWMGRELQRYKATEEQRGKEVQARGLEGRQSVPNGFIEAVQRQIKAQRRPKI